MDFTWSVPLRIISNETHEALDVTCTGQSDLPVVRQIMNTSLSIIVDHKAAFLLVKTVLHKISISIYGRRTKIIDLSYNIDECLTANDYFTD